MVFKAASVRVWGVGCMGLWSFGVWGVAPVRWLGRSKPFLAPSNSGLRCANEGATERDYVGSGGVNTGL